MPKNLKPCIYCGEAFLPERGAYRHCSRKCRFYDKVRYNPSKGCMEWTAMVVQGKRGGYGRLQCDGRPRPATHIRYELETGKGIPEGVEICHICDNPKCVTFAHFFVGSHLDNMLDMCKKGRHGRITIPDEIKDAAVEAYKSGRLTQKELAERLGVSQASISHWVTGKFRAK